METKMNWGKGLVIGMSIFMLFIIGLAVAIFSQKTDDYDHSYYEKGLDFDKDYKREQQVIVDNAKPVLKIEGNILQLSFKERAQGELHFQRPSDGKMDKEIALKTDSAGRFEIPLTRFAKGSWQLIFEWNSRDKQYLYQQQILIP